MDAALSAKAASMCPHFPNPQEGDLVLDAGSGTGALAELILQGALVETDIQHISRIVNDFELCKKWQLDTNPFSWFRVGDQMVYVSGKVYLYDERWEFRRVGLSQWLDPQYVSCGQNFSAQISPLKVYQSLCAAWQLSDSRFASWKKYLHPKVQPSLEI